MKEEFYQNNFPNNPYSSNERLDMYHGVIPNPTYPIPNKPIEEFSLQNILQLNKGKKVEIFMTFPHSNEYRDKAFSGIIEQSGKDHIILSDPTTGKWFLLLNIYINYIKFDEKINYNKEFN